MSMMELDCGKSHGFYLYKSAREQKEKLSCRRPALAHIIYFILRGQLYERNWFTFGSPWCFKDKSDLNIYLFIVWRIICWVHKRSENGPEIAFYYILKLQRIFTQLFKCFSIEYSVPVWPQTFINIWDFHSVYGSGELAWSGKVNQFI